MENNLISMIELQLRNFTNDLRPIDEDIRKELDFGFSWDGQTALLFEIRSKWNSPDDILHVHFAKLKYSKLRKSWKLYWKRASGKWELYGSRSESKNPNELLDEIIRDPYGCFFS
ncbi:DUF3024 domain-containing protein [Flavobacterium psychroterrae]|uniref:DUF3024 domain-containing protein n=1 Tax=Flavobacterium psychroterrae TaxID=2133767 RepID=A0ABS5PAP2_9FLAO|nr:DUF3024 domain-containing protein [Flavobacterium psychroterrae]MBS7231344.1 DUF3024 domain-containing protein [Flavobacterium psychroterrae]